MKPGTLPCLALALAVSPAEVLARPLASADFYRMRSAGSVALSPDGSRVA